MTLKPRNPNEGEFSAKLERAVRQAGGDPVEARLVSVAMGKVLRQTLRSRVEATPDGTLPASELHLREEAAFATYLMEITSTDARFFAKVGCPDYTANFNVFYISGILAPEGETRK